MKKKIKITEIKKNLNCGKLKEEEIRERKK
jgi:hypothetical protein